MEKVGFRYLANKYVGVLRNLVPFIQFKKREKHPWRSVTFIKVAGISRLRSVSYVVVFIADKIGRNFRVFLTSDLCTFS